MEPTEPPKETAPPGFSWALLAIGLVFLAASIGAAFVLAGKTLSLWQVPGCGEGSPCEQAAASAWGRVPGLGWPTSFVGLAYFIALAAAWIRAWRGGTVPSLLRYLVWAGVAVSVVLLVAMIAGGYACLYCVAAHLGNFGFLFVMEAAPRRAAGAARVLAWGAAAFVASTGLEIGGRAYVTARSERELRWNIQEITRPRESPADPGAAPFTGRYLLGPEKAPIRVVTFSDFQCPDCRKLEMQIRQVMARRDDVSVSHLHFPFCTDCNPSVRGNLHPNACWAARASEAAGILRGNGGYWQMHHWLFDRGGAFTDAELIGGLKGFGYDVPEFLGVMEGPETLARVKADVDQAVSLGLYRTPTVFINGTELRAWYASEALAKTIDALAETNPPPGDGSQDHPPPAPQKCVNDWLMERSADLGPDARAWTMGPADAAVAFVMWGDYEEPNSAEADAIVRRIVASRGDTSYTFRHYPINRSCNPIVPAEISNLHPNACRMARAAEAAGILGGNDAYWAMHVWLFEHQQDFSDETLAAAAKDMGLSPEALRTAMDTPAVSQEIAADGKVAGDLRIRSIPFIFVNDKLVFRWRLGDEPIMERIAEMAAEK